MNTSRIWVSTWRDGSRVESTYHSCRSIQVQYPCPHLQFTKHLCIHSEEPTTVLWLQWHYTHMSTHTRTCTHIPHTPHIIKIKTFFFKSLDEKRVWTKTRSERSLLEEYLNEIHKKGELFEEDIAAINLSNYLSNTLLIVYPREQCLKVKWRQRRGNNVLVILDFLNLGIWPQELLRESGSKSILTE